MATPEATELMPPVAEDYLALIRRFPLVRIRDDVHLEAAHAVVDRLSIIGEDDLTAGQMDYLLALGDLTTVYEQDVLDEMTRNVTGLDLLRHLVEEHGLVADDVGRIIGQPAAGLDVLGGSRPITGADARALGARFGVAADLLLR